MDDIKHHDHYKKVFGFNSDVVYYKMNFLEKFAVIGNDTRVDLKDFKIEIETVISLAKKMGHTIKFSNAKKFYGNEVSEKIISIPAFDTKYNRFELGAVFKFPPKKNLISGGTWANIANMLSDYQIKHFNPKCETAQEMEFILENYFKIYEELKVGMIDYFKGYKI
ncbi:hypothetical protein ACFOWM_13485 [Ferruginibacter yonginensis]|uniref:Uncharacterized protein n=1 Tax=Ferruginibacter yonginensis TaxID=1310416 RepID=A0ABV8QUH2_9BACT